MLIVGHNHLGGLENVARKKWPKNQALYISFYECENRIAKYIEQLFLDTYDFYLNSSENNGSGTLYARWGKERFEMKDEIEKHSYLLDRKYGDQLEIIVNNWGDDNKSTE